MKTPSLGIAIVLATLCLDISLVWAQGGQDEGIGLFTAVQGAVTVTHPGAVNPLKVNVHDEVLFKDLIQTLTESRTKAFFEDDSILTVGENSRIEITEHIYNPNRNMRRMVVKLVQGRLRALVSKVFTGSGSKFEIHTPTAVAAARGTYFVVWVENGMTGVVNIGNSGRVDFTSEGKTVTLNPGEYSVAAPGEAPIQPLVYNYNVGATAAKNLATQVDGTIDNTLEKTTETVGKTLGTVNNLVGQGASVLASAWNAIDGTVLKDAPRPELARDTIRASSPTGTPIGQATPATQTTSVVTSAVSVTPTTTIAPTVLATPTVTLAPVTTVVPVTPPAVISGAANTLTKTLK